MLKIFKQLAKNNRGMTLVEVMISIALVIMMTLLAMTGLSGFRDRSQLKQGALDVFNLVREAQTLAMTTSDEQVVYYVVDVMPGQITLGRNDSSKPINSAYCREKIDNKCVVLFGDGKDVNRQKMSLSSSQSGMYFPTKQEGKICTNQSCSIYSNTEILVKHKNMGDKAYYAIVIKNNSISLETRRK